MRLFLFVVFVYCDLNRIDAGYLDYYWRDYNGAAAPSDAVPGGRDADGVAVYIGQAYIHEHGIAVVLIRPGVKEVEVPMYGYKKTDKLIKILCSQHPKNFAWHLTSARSMALDTIDKQPIAGGYDHRHDVGVLNIGRVKHGNQLKIGSVAAYDADNALLYYPHHNNELHADKYEILIYADAPPPPTATNTTNEEANSKIIFDSKERS